MKNLKKLFLVSALGVSLTIGVNVANATDATSSIHSQSLDLVETQKSLVTESNSNDSNSSNEANNSEKSNGIDLELLKAKKKYRDFRLLDKDYFQYRPIKISDAQFNQFLDEIKRKNFQWKYNPKLNCCISRLTDLGISPTFELVNSEGYMRVMLGESYDDSTDIYLIIPYDYIILLDKIQGLKLYETFFADFKKASQETTDEIFDGFMKKIKQ